MTWVPHDAPWWRRYRITTVYIAVVATANLALLVWDQAVAVETPSGGCLVVNTEGETP